MLNDIFQKFSVRSKRALKNAFSLALSSGHKNISPAHILFGIIEERGSVGAEILIKSKVTSYKLKSQVLSRINPVDKLLELELTESSQRLLEKAVLISSSNNHKYVGTEHLMAAILEINDKKINDFFQTNNVNIGDLKKQADSALGSADKFLDLTEAVRHLENKNPSLSSDHGFGSQNYSLNSFATELTDPKVQEKIDPVIGRGSEIERLIQIISRRNKNNPLLLGDPGVGKTAIVEGLAKKIVEGQVPESLLNKKVYSLDLSSLVAGTSFRGEFENRIKQVLKEAKENPNIIIFIDELHNIIGAGAAAGSMDAANILKPALARGEIRCIGATTLEEYKKSIENDAALERRFQSMIVDQPSVEETFEIIKGIRDNYEKFHNTKISDEIIQTAIKLSDRFIPEKFLPDKAIDIIDEASAITKTKKIKNKNIDQFRQLEKDLILTKNLKDKMVTEENFDKALECKKQEDQIQKNIKALEKKLSKNKKNVKSVVITQKDILKTISKITNIPINDLVKEEKKSLLNLENKLTKKIVGQKEALKTVAEFIRKSKAGISSPDRPIGSFMFLGPSGVGKTELAKVLAENVFGSLDNLIRIDMSEFNESFNISKLIGAPAGYVGYKEGAKLVDSIKKKPHSVVLFDEIEKAHPQIFNLLLQILDEGYLTDSTGKKANFRNSIIIMTSNIGSDKFKNHSVIGFDSDKKDLKKQLESFQEIKNDVTKSLKKSFPPEFLDRLDKTIIFEPLTPKDIEKIADLQTKQLIKRLKNQGIETEIDKKVSKIIANLSYSPHSGARTVRKTIQDTLEVEIAKKLLSTSDNQKKVTVKAINDKIIV